MRGSRNVRFLFWGGGTAGWWLGLIPPFQAFGIYSLLQQLVPVWLTKANKSFSYLRQVFCVLMIENSRLDSKHCTLLPNEPLGIL